MLNKKIFSALKKLIIKRPYRNFRFLEKTKEEKEIDQVNRKHYETHKNKYFLELVKKKIDIIKVESNLLEKQKIIIKPVRLRHELDTYDFLTTNSEVPCYINARDSLPNLHFILHKSQVKQINNLAHIYNRPLYLLINDEEIRVTLKHSRIHPNLKIHYHTVFERYITGSKNIIKMKLFFNPKNHFKYVLKDINLIYSEIELISYNDIYPAKLELDFYRILRKEKFTFGDLSNMLPPGLELVDGDKKRLNASVASLHNYQSKKAEDVFFLEQTKMMEHFEEQVVEKVNPLLEKRQKVLEERKEEKKRKAALKPKMNLKQQLKGEQDKLRGLFQEIENRK